MSKKCHVVFKQHLTAASSYRRQIGGKQSLGRKKLPFATFWAVLDYTEVKTQKIKYTVLMKQFFHSGLLWTTAVESFHYLSICQFTFNQLSFSLKNISVSRKPVLWFILVFVFRWPVCCQYICLYSCTLYTGVESEDNLFCMSPLIVSLCCDLNAGRTV